MHKSLRKCLITKKYPTTYNMNENKTIIYPFISVCTNVSVDLFHSSVDQHLVEAKYPKAMCDTLQRVPYTSAVGHQVEEVVKGMMDLIATKIKIIYSHYDGYGMCLYHIILLLLYQ